MAKEPAKAKVKIHFEPDNIDIVVDKGTNLLEAAIQAGIHVSASCGGAGTCGTCKVIIEKGSVESSLTRMMSEEELAQSLRQACQSQVLTDLVVRVPVESRLEMAIVAREKKSLSNEALGTLATGWKFQPPVNKLYLQLPPPSLKDNISDLSRLMRGLKQDYRLTGIAVDFEVLKKMPQVLREANWKVTATVLQMSTEVEASGNGCRLKLINVEPGDTRDRSYSLAFDIGTTTICGQLLDLNRGKVVAEAMEYNQQISYGADIISRIAFSQKPGGLKKLQQAVVATVNEVSRQLLATKKVDVADIGHLMLSGNTTMLQIMLGIDPKYLRLSPYTPTLTHVPPVKAISLGISVGAHVYLFSFPLVASYVGGDIVSGVIASGMHQRKNLTFYLDVGTNGEIVVGNSDWMVTAACSAGPTFEGGGIKHGMIATSGAIEDFSLDPKTLKPTIHTIGDAKPKGICGSGLINIVAEMLEAGVITPKGKFQTELGISRIRSGKDGFEYVLASAAESQLGKEIVITEVDIDNLIRAKAAMYAGFKTLADSVGIDPRDIEQVIIAGNFGNRLNIEKAITIGLLPDLPRDRFVFIGNGSLMGARLASYSVDMLDDARKVAGTMTNLELSENAIFIDNYIAALFLPHTNANQFLSVARKLADIELKWRHI